MRLNRIIFGALLILGLSSTAWAQMDEIIVTGTRIDSSMPGLFMEKRGDFLLLEVSIENDSRDLKTRLKEINETMQGIIAKAAGDPSIELSIVDDNEFVRPLSMETFKSGIRGGSRPDTSRAFLKVKTAIPDQVADSYKLAQKLGEFVDGLNEVGRTDIDTYDDISVSVVNPYGYRKDLLSKITSEIRDLTGQLGPDYRAVISGLDAEMKWVRSGDLNLAFYIPYEFTILPTSIATYQVDVYEE